MTVAELIRILAQHIVEKPEAAMQPISLWLPDAQDTAEITRCFVNFDEISVSTK